jgi:hypothetical protein
MMEKTYAFQLAKRHRELITLINGGVTPHDSVMNGKHWLLFEIEEDGKDSKNHQIVTERNMMQTHDLIGSPPFLIRVKK